MDLHCLDRIQHWNAQDSDRAAQAYRRMDAFIAAMAAKCRRHGVLLAVASDHGMEPVKKIVDIRARLAELNVSEADYDLFIENVRCALWFHNPDARRRLLRSLEASDDGTLV